MININYNYNEGAFVEILSELTGTQYKVTCNSIPYSKNVETVWEIIENHWVKTSAKYYVPWSIKIENLSIDKTIWENIMSLENQLVFIKIEITDVDKVSELLPILSEFSKVHKCKVHTYTDFSGLFMDEFPEIFFEESPDVNMDPKYAASYYIGLYYREDGTLNPDYHPNVHLSENNMTNITRDILGLFR